MRLVDGPHGVGPAGAGADLAEHAGELVGERAGHRGDRAVERLLEAEAGLDADDEQVEDVGQLRSGSACCRSSTLRLRIGVGAEDAGSTSEQAERAELQHAGRAERGRDEAGRRTTGIERRP